MSIARKFALLGVLAIAGLAAGVSAVPAATTTPTIVCLNNGTTVLPVEIAYAGGTATLNESRLEALEQFQPPGNDGLFWAGFSPYYGYATIYVPDYPGQTAPVAGFYGLDPGYSTNRASRGACPVVDRQFWLCFSKSRNPGVYSRTTSEAELKGGMTLPVAVPDSAGLSDTVIGHGWALTCDVPADWTLGSLAVSTGGGESFEGGVGAGLLQSNPLDYTRNAVPPGK